MGKSKILIIDDNPDTRRFLTAMLDKEFEVICAENGVIGMEFARLKFPDLILLDIMLPILSGYDVCTLLKKTNRRQEFRSSFFRRKTQLPTLLRGSHSVRMITFQSPLITKSS